MKAAEQRARLDPSTEYDKFIPMGARRAKVAFSIDNELLQRVEALRARTGESRSALIARALSFLTAEEAHREKVERYVAAYREQPESRAEIEAARRVAARTLRSLPWDV